MYQVVLIENELPSKDAFVKAFDKETGGDFKKLTSTQPATMIPVYIGM